MSQPGALKVLTGSPRAHRIRLLPACGFLRDAKVAEFHFVVVANEDLATGSILELSSTFFYPTFHGLTLDGLISLWHTPLL